MLIDPISIAFAGAQAGLSLISASATSAAQEQDYLNQTALQDANNTFALWQANFNATTQDVNNQYRYWVDTVNYNQQLAYTNGLRNLELLRSIRQAEIVRDTRAAAGASFVIDSQAVSDAYGQASMQEAVALQQYQWRALQARASVQASGQEGRSVDRLVNDYARQMGDYATLQDINTKIRQRQYTRDQAAQVSTYLTRWNSQTFYEEQPYIDPTAPFAPLPTLVTPPGPTLRGAPPSGASTALNIGTGLLGAASTGLSINNTLQGIAKPPGGPGPGTTGGG